LLHIKTPSQANLGFDRLLSSHSATYRGSQETPISPQTQALPTSSSCHLPPPQFNLLSSQLHNQSSQLYNASMFSSTPALLPTAPLTPQPSSERAVSRQDSVIKHYQRSSPTQSTTLPPQQYVSCGGSSSYQQIASHHRHAGVSCSPLGEQSPSSDPKPPTRLESKIYRPIIQSPYASSASSTSAPSSTGTKGPKNPSSNSGYSSSGSASSSSLTQHTPPSASSTSSSSSKTSTGSLSAPSCLPDQTPTQQHAQSYSPNQPPSAHITQSYGGFSSPHAQDLSSGAGDSGGKAFTGTRGRSFSAEVVFGDSSFGSTPLRRAGSPSLGYGSAGGSTVGGPVSGATSLGSGVGSTGSGSGAASVGNGGNSSYHLSESCPSPSINSTISRSGLHSPASVRPAQSPGGSGATKYLSSILSPPFMSSPQGFPDTRQTQSQSYHTTPPKPKTDNRMLGVQQSQNNEEDEDDFLIHHLLHAQSSTPHPSQHHPSPQQLPQPLSQARDGEGKGLTYNINKISEERYHLQSVIRTNNITSSSGAGTAMDDVGLNSQMDASQKKSQQAKSELTVSKSNDGAFPSHLTCFITHSATLSASPKLSAYSTHPALTTSSFPLPQYSPPDPPQQTHILQSVLSHTTCTKMDPQQAPSQQHPLSQQTMMASSGRVGPAIVETHPQNQSSQLQLQLQTQRFGFGHPLTCAPPQPGSSPCPQPCPPSNPSTLSPSDDTLSVSSPTVPPNDSKYGNSATTAASTKGQQQQRFAPLTSICFPDSLLHDEDRSFFPEMEDMFCSADYKGQEAMEALKTGGDGEGYDMVGHPSDQNYGQYCHSLPGTGNGSLHLDLDSMKTHELPSTVNTDQLGLIQSQTPNIALSSNTTGLSSPIFCSSRPKKLLKTSSFHLLKQRREPQTQTKKNYAQEYEFEDDENKADVPADIRLNSRRLPDLLPDLVSSCRKVGGTSGVSALSPLTSDLDFCNPSSFASFGHPPQLLPHDGPKKRGRKPTKPKREGPPRPRGRPRIRPLPEPPYCRGLMGSVTGESRRGRGRGRGRGKRHKELQREPIRPVKIKLPIPTMSSSECLLRTDSLSSTEQVLSDGSVGEQTIKKLKQADEKAFDFKPGFMASFLDFLKTGKKQSGFEMGHDGGEQDSLNPCSSMKGGIRPLSPPPPPLPPTPPQRPPQTFGEGGQGDSGDLALSSCPSPCKPLDEELKGNLETLPSFSSDEEDSVGKNQDLQESISSAISALYDTPHSLAAAVASAMAKALPNLSPSIPHEPPLTPPVPAMPSLIPSLTTHPPSFLDSPSEPMPAPGPPSPSPSITPLTPPTYSSPSPLPLPAPTGTSPPPSTSPPAIPPSPNLSLGQSIPPPSTTPPPSSSDQDQEPDADHPEEAPTSQRLTSLHLAKKQADAAIAGESEEEDSESGGEGIFRERDEFVVRTEDIGTLKMALQTGREPPPIWRVQKALLQKFSPEIKDGQRQFCATSNYLGYFGDAKMRYQRLYVKFLENVNKKDFVRVCSRKPWHRAGLALRGGTDTNTTSAAERWRLSFTRCFPCCTHSLTDGSRCPNRCPPLRTKRHPERNTDRSKQKQRLDEEEKRMACRPRAKTSKDKAEPPPKKRKKWMKEVPSSSSSSDSSRPSDDEGPVRGGVNSRAMREVFRSYVEMLVSTALDPDMIQALEDTDDELYLPPMRKIDSLLGEQKKRLLRRVNMSVQHQEALHIFPKMMADPLDCGAVKVHLGGEGYNRKTLNRVKRSIPKQQDLRLSIESGRMYSLYHSLHHYKYHTFLHCKKETDSIEQAAEDPGQEEVVQQCMANQGWLESLFNSFMELLS
uniref:Proline rich 12b n=1 Tax=Gasterosteus aculeatus TaxID=69293 RepID=G3NM21_GASAC